jgi:pentatricopeptide repeat domain-containing protein 1
MKKRSLRFDYDGAREVVELMIKKANLEPDIVTYGVLALGCQTRQEAWALVNEMKKNGIKMNMPILGAMLKQGCCNHNFEYIKDILYIMKKLVLTPNEKIIEILDIFVKSCNYTKKKDNKNIPANYRKNAKEFKVYLDQWKKDMGIPTTTSEEEKKLLKERPWDQFKDVQPEGFEDPKNQKLEQKRKLQRHIKRIKARDVVIKTEEIASQ